MKCICLLCNESFDILEVGERTIEQLNKHEMWSVFCSYLHLNAEEWKQFQNSYDNLPFCQKCLVSVESLLMCHNQLQSLQKKVQHTVADFSVNIIQLHNKNNNNDNDKDIKSENDQLCRQIRKMRKNIAKSYQPHVVLPQSNINNIILDKQKTSMTVVDHHKSSNNDDDRKEQMRNADNITITPSTTTTTINNNSATLPSIAASSNSDDSVNAEHPDHLNKKAKNDFFNGQHNKLSNYFSIEPELSCSNVSTNRFINCPKCHRPFYNIEDLKRHQTLRSCGDATPPIIDITNKWHWIVDPKTGQKSWFYDAIWPVQVITGSKGETKYKCGSCLMSSGISANREDVGDHIYISHIAPNSILCPESGCGRACSSSYHLELHKATAHTYKPYKCNQCDLSFKLESTLTFHQKLIHKPKEMEVIEIPQPQNQQEQHQQKTPAPKIAWVPSTLLKTEQFIENTAPLPDSNEDSSLSQMQFQEENEEEAVLDPLSILDNVQIEFKTESDIIVPEVKHLYENFYDEAEMEEENQNGNVNMNVKVKPIISNNNPNIIIKEGPDVIDLTLDDEENENDVIVVKEEGIFFYKRWSYVHTQLEGEEVFGCLTCGEMIMGHENTIGHIQFKHENVPDD